MDLVTLATLSMFGAFAVGGLLGVVVGHCTRFEVGLGAGLLVPGGVCLWFAAQCLADYQAFQHAGPNGAWGEVTAVEERAVNAAGDILQPVAVVRFTAPDGSVHTIDGPKSSSLKVGQGVNVIYDPVNPARSRVGQLSELRGGALGMLLFGTFPFTLGLWFLYAYARNATARQTPARRERRKPVGGSRTGGLVPKLLYAAMFGGIVWIGAGPGELGLRFAHGFGVIALALFGYAIWGMANRVADSIWAAGMATLGINFGVWAFAMVLLFA